MHLIRPAVPLHHFPKWPALLLLVALAWLPAPAHTEPVRNGAVAAELVAETDGIQPGKPFTVALRLAIDPGWHTYWINPGDAGFPTKIVWTLPPGFTAGAIQFPYPHRFVVDFGGLKQVGLGYTGEVLHLIEITPPADLAPGTSITLSGKADWLMCDDMQCVPGNADLSLTLPVAASAAPSTHAEAFGIARSQLPAPAPAWTVAVAPAGEKDLNFTVALPAGAKSPDPASLVLYPEAQNVIALNAAQAFRAEDGKLILTVPKAPYAGEIPSPMAVVLISEAGFPDFGGRRALRITSDTPQPAVPVPASPEPVAASGTPPPPTSQPAQSSATVVEKEGPFGGGILGYLVAGFLGGMILNIMPCVFPVISLKILSFVSHAGESRKKVLIHGGVYTLGILLFFVGLAAILIVVQAGWGAFQFQSPVFVMVMTAIIVVLSLSLFGVFEFGMKLTGFGGKLTQSTGYAGSFWSGALAVVLATPCTGPFLGTSLGWAFTQTPAVNLTFFTFMGLGMAAPYVILTAFPTLTRHLPRPGAWMETFKQVMGFPMLAAAIYLLWILEGQIGNTGQAFFMGALILLSLATWAWGKYGHLAASPARSIGLVTAGIALAGSVALSLEATKQTDSSEDGAVADTRPIAEIIETHRQAGKHVFVDFTARWCAICQTNKPAMHAEETKAALSRLGVEFVVADWTNKNDDIYQFLKKHQRRSIPYYPLFPADTTKGPIELPQNLTVGIILDHLKKLDDVAANFPPRAAD
jgi:thiol:disulfide interchange protein/DsbC/DsbD-like thiol-disulfide interchange protein